MTYLNVYQAATSDVGVFIQTLKLSSLKGLEWASEAIHQYQSLTGVARCTCIVQLDPDSTTGSYNLSSDIDIIEKIDFYGNGVGSVQGAIPVNLVDIDYFNQNEQGYMLPSTQGYSTLQQPIQQIVGMNIPNQISQNSTGAVFPTQFYASQYGKCNLKFWPFQGTVGSLKIYYKPYLLPYTPDAEGRWSMFGNPPDATMATEHIPREFNAAYEGIKSYVAAMIVNSIPNHLKILPGKYQEYMAKFASGVEMILKTNPPLGINNKTRPAFIRRIM